MSQRKCIRQKSTPRILAIVLCAALSCPLTPQGVIQTRALWGTPCNSSSNKKKNCLVYKPVFGVHHPAKLVLHEEVVWLMYSRILCVCIKRCQQLSNEMLMLPGLKCDSLPADSMASKQEMRHTKTNVIFWGFEIDSKMFGSHVVFSFSFISIDPSLPPHVHVCIHVELYL